MLYLVRHGQTEANARGVLLGRADPSLSTLGRQQATALREMLPRDARVVSSPLRRATETAAALGRPVTIDERWIELDYGTLDGTPLADVPTELWRRWREDLDFSPGEGESLTSLGRRVRAACESIREEARDADVIVVSHVSPIKSALGWALGTDDAIAWRMFIEIASIARVGFDHWGASVKSVNEIPHVSSHA